VSLNSSKIFTNYGQKSETPLLILSIVFLIIALMQVFLAPQSSAGLLLDLVNWIVWAVFVADYAIRLYLSSTKWKWIISHPLDLAMVLLPLLRPLRLLRVLPVLVKLFKSGKVSLAGRSLVLVASGLFLVTIPAAIALFQIESDELNSPIKSGGDAIWWAVTTVTTVGYGDMYPVTTAGRVISVFVIFLGISFIGVLTAAVASWFVEQADNDLADKNDIRELLERISHLENQIKAISDPQSEIK
jgi:voltage-gated potassium channel